MVSYNADLVKVKQVANIESSISTFDTELQAKLDAAYNYINLILDRYTTVPLTTVPDIIKEIEADIAAGYFKEDRTVPVEGERIQKSILRARGEEKLQAYIDTTHTLKGGNRRNLFRHNKNRVKPAVDRDDADLVYPYESRDL
jgi:phage gp36-like protein